MDGEEVSGILLFWYDPKGPGANVEPKSAAIIGAVEARAEGRKGMGECWYGLGGRSKNNGRAMGRGLTVKAEGVNKRGGGAVDVDATGPGVAGVGGVFSASALRARGVARGGRGVHKGQIRFEAE